MLEEVVPFFFTGWRRHSTFVLASIGSVRVIHPTVIAKWLFFPTLESVSLIRCSHGGFSTRTRIFRTLHTLLLDSSEVRAMSQKFEAARGQDMLKEGKGLIPPKRSQRRENLRALTILLLTFFDFGWYRPSTATRRTCCKRYCT